MPTLKPLREQTIVLTGATSGIGLATARLAARRGARLVIAARNAEALGEVARTLRERGAEVEPVALDVADPDTALGLRDAAITRFGGFDSWINNAAAAVYGRVEEVSLADHRRVFEVGYFGLVQGSLAAAGHLKAKGGAIINVGSVLSDRTMIYQGPYSAMKHAVKGFTDALRMELEAAGAPISVTLIKPSGINTPYPEHARNYLPMPVRIPPLLYDPRLVARAILFAAANPRRDLTVGGAGFFIQTIGTRLPRLTDRVMERFGLRLQAIDTPPPPASTDNLHAPREDGEMESRQDVFVRRTSLFLEAQMRPGLPFVVSGALSAGLLVARNLMGRRR